MEENKRLEQGFDDPGRQVLRNIIVHFTTTANNSYDVWADVVRQYLLTAYNTEEKHSAIPVAGKIYKVLKRDGVTVFYDESGQTLFDVENDRLAKEHELLSAENAAEEPVEESTEEPMEAPEEKPGEGPKSQIGKVIAGIERQAFDAAVNSGKTEDTEGKKDPIPMGTTSLAEIVAGIPAPTEEEIQKAEEENAKPVKQKAREKLEKELQSAKDKGFADPVIKYLLERLEQSNSLAVDICQPHKTWDKCNEYIYKRAEKQATQGRCAVRSDIVFEWAEDYYHKDDKAEEEKKAREKKQKEESKKLDAAAKRAQEKAKKNKKEEKATEKKPAVTEPKKTEKKEAPKKKSNELEGQMDLFSMMGL